MDLLVHVGGTLLLGADEGRVTLVAHLVVIPRLALDQGGAAVNVGLPAEAPTVGSILDLVLVLDCVEGCSTDIRSHLWASSECSCLQVPRWLDQ